MQENKSLLKKMLLVVCCVCLSLAFVFGLTACGKDTVENVVVNDDSIVVTLTNGENTTYALTGVTDAKLDGGKLVLTYKDGATKSIVLNTLDKTETKIAADGKTNVVLSFADGSSKTIELEKVVKDVESDGDKVIVTYSDNSTDEFELDATCDHKYGPAKVIKKASCSEEGIAIKVCEKCGGVAEEVVELDPNAHGKWEFNDSQDLEIKKIIRVISDGYNVMYEYAGNTNCYTLNTDGYKDVKSTGLELISGACPDYVCTACGGSFSEHMDYTTDTLIYDNFGYFPVYDNNPCETERIEFYACKNCHAKVVDDENRSVPAVGHNYEVTNATLINAGGAYKYEITLTCTVCGAGCNNHVQVVETEDYGAPSCRYNYTYTNLVGGVETEIDAVYVPTGSDLNYHTLVDKHGVLYGSNLEYNDLEQYFEDGSIERTAEGPATCSEYKDAQFVCATCDKLVIVKVSGKHTLSAGAPLTQAATCTADGYDYKICTVCDNEIRTGTTYPALGHSYEADTADWALFIANPDDYLDGSANYVTFNCVRGDSSLELQAEKVAGTNCANKTKYIFYNGDTAVKVYEVAVNTHKLGNFVLTYDGEYDYNTLASYIGTRLNWTATGPTDCSDHKDAAFTCDLCGKLVVIKLSGEHDVTGSVVLTVDATCVKQGYKYQVCNNVGTHEVKTGEIIPATGHTLVADSTEWDAFVADVVANKDTQEYAYTSAVTFTCDCGASFDIVPTVSFESSDCVMANIYTFTIRYNTFDYTGLNFVAEKTDTFTYSTDIAKHKIAEGFDNIEYGAELEYNDYEPVIDAGLLYWTATGASLCTDHKDAAFTCVRCNKLVVVKLSGEHDIEGQPLVPATCTEKPYKECKDCGYHVIQGSALGHDYQWVLTTPTTATMSWSKVWNSSLKKYEVYANAPVITAAGKVTGTCSRVDACGEAPVVINTPYNDTTMTGYEVVVDSIINNNCAESGSLTIKWYLGVDRDGDGINDSSVVVYTERVVLAKLANHLCKYTDNDAVVVETFVADTDTYYLAYYCKCCDNYIIIYEHEEKEVIDTLATNYMHAKGATIKDYDSIRNKIDGRQVGQTAVYEAIFKLSSGETIVLKTGTETEINDFVAWFKNPCVA